MAAWFGSRLAELIPRRLGQPNKPFVNLVPVQAQVRAFYFHSV